MLLADDVIALDNHSVLFANSVGADALLLDDSWVHVGLPGPQFAYLLEHPLVLQFCNVMLRGQ